MKQDAYCNQWYSFPEGSHQGVTRSTVMPITPEKKSLTVHENTKATRLNVAIDAAKETTASRWITTLVGSIPNKTARFA